MIKAGVNYNKCKICKKCVARRACPTKALFKLDEDEPAVVDLKLCHGCGDCVAACPHKALYIKEF
ncbi:MAG: 4Fe-4S binding protein [Actinomycetota bacterium]|nr:4Fe-4S binding protein [Actinomycetota bacterium]